MNRTGHADYDGYPDGDSADSRGPDEHPDGDTALPWLVYVPYEFGMKLRILCSGECNTRFELGVIYPVLLVGSIIELVYFAVVRGRRIPV